MEGTVENFHLEVDDGKACQHTAYARLLNAAVHGRDVLPGNRAAHDLVDELVAAAARRRCDAHPAVAELAAAARLLLVLALPLGAALQRFSIRDLRARQLRLDTILSPQLGE